MVEIPYQKVQEKYGGEFVALKKSRVVAHAKTMAGLFEELEKKRVPYGPAIRISRVHPPDAVCIYKNRL